MINYINPTSQFYQFWPNWTKSPIRIHTSPRNFNFSKFTKLINHQDQVYNIIGTKSNDQFQNIWLESTKIPKRIGSKIPTKCMKKMHENMKINAKGRVKWTYRLGERKTLQKDRWKMTKIWKTTCSICKKLTNWSSQKVEFIK